MTPPCPAMLLRQRDTRERILPGLRETEWLMLILLWDAIARHRKLIVSNLMNGCYAPPTTALRHINRLERKGLIEREADPHDERSTFIRLTTHAREKLDAYSVRLAA